MFKEFKPGIHTLSHKYSYLGLYPVWVGHLTADMEYECKPRILDDYFIIYVSSGEGELRCAGKEYVIKRNDAYFLFPGVVHSYNTHAERLLDLWWIGFNGSNAGRIIDEIGVHPGSPIVRNIQHESFFEVIKEMIDISDDFYTSDLLKSSGNLYKIMGILMEKCSPGIPCNLDFKKTYSKSISRAISYIKSNYSQQIKIADIAKYSCLSRSHFTVLFKQEVGISPIDFLEKLRTENAKRFLADPRLSISEVAHSVGFQDPLHFSKFFKKHIGLSPRLYRKCI